MKFNRRLQAHLTPEWRKQYINYGRLKALIYAAQENAPSSGNVRADKEYFEEIEADYIDAIKVELKKVETFFKVRELEAKSNFALLKTEVQKLRKILSDEPGRQQQYVQIPRDKAIGLWASGAVKVGKKGGETTKRVRRVVKSGSDGEMATLSKRDIRSRLDALKLAFSEFYLNLILLQQFQVLNREGFRKILKKHDKEWRTEDGLKFYRTVILHSYFVKSNEVDSLISQVENTMIDDLEEGNRRRAMNRLRVPPLESDQVSHSSMFLLGLNIGMSTILIISAVLVGIFLANFQSPVACKTSPRLNYSFSFESNISHRNELNNSCLSGDWVRISAVRMFRVSLFLAVMIFLIGVNTLGWRARGVNHVLIFEVNPRDHLTAFQLMGIGSYMFVVWLICLIGFFVTCQCWSEKFSFFWPVAVLVVFVLYTINPFKIFQYSSRRWFLGIMRRIVCAPFYAVHFPDFWIADQWTSLGSVLLDLYFIICFFIFMWDKEPGGQNCSVCTSVTNGIRPILAALPSWFRFAQCLRRYHDTKAFFPHAVNAGKYSTGLIEVLFFSLYHSYKENGGSSQRGVLFGCWIVSLIFVFVYKLYWDLYMDWGLLRKKHRLLRQELIYRVKWLYYIAIVENIVLRLLWTLNVSIVEAETNRLDVEVLKTIFSLLELIRRFIWNFFRLENEHLNNAGQFRATRDISIKPLTKSEKRNDSNVTMSESLSDVVITRETAL